MAIENLLFPLLNFLSFSIDTFYPHYLTNDIRTKVLVIKIFIEDWKI